MGFITTNLFDLHHKTNEQAYSNVESFKVYVKKGTVRIKLWTYSSRNARTNGGDPINIKAYVYPLSLFGDCISLSHIYTYLRTHTDLNKPNIENVYEIIIRDSDKYTKGEHISWETAEQEGLVEGVDYIVEKNTNLSLNVGTSYGEDGNVIEATLLDLQTLRSELLESRKKVETKLKEFIDVNGTPHDNAESSVVEEYNKISTQLESLQHQVRQYDEVISFRKNEIGEEIG